MLEVFLHFRRRSHFPLDANWMTLHLYWLSTVLMPVMYQWNIQKSPSELPARKRGCFRISLLSSMLLQPALSHARVDVQFASTTKSRRGRALYRRTPYVNTKIPMSAYCNMTLSIVIRKYHEFALLVRTFNIKPTHYEATLRQHNIKRINGWFRSKIMKNMELIW